jgi:outer membrane receptor protein involved in Fe transport
MGGENMQFSLFAPHALRVSIGAAIAATVALAPAWAQEDSATDEFEGGFYIEEIVITAQKREENLQETPLAITALGSADIEDRGIKNMADLFSSAPGIAGYEAPSSRGNLGLSLRGIGSGNASNLSIDPANGVYVDGVYLGKAMGLGVDQMDLERIEILRGPQGTLYGRNSTGGAINFITAKPGEDFALNLQASAGNYSMQEYKARIDIPFSEKFKTYVSARTRTRDHLYDNTSGGEGFENIDRQGYRVALRLEPTADLTIDYAYDRSEMKEEVQALNMVSFNPAGAGVLTADGFPTETTINSPNRYDTVAAIQGGFQQSLDFGLIPSIPQTVQYNQWLIDWLAWADANANGASQRDGFAGSAESIHTGTNDHDGHALTIAWDVYDLGFLGDVEFKSITGYREMYNINRGDLDGQDNTVDSGVLFHGTLQAIGGAYFAQFPVIPPATQFALANSIVDQINGRGYAETFNSHQINDYKQFSQELQMVGGTDRVDYAVGLFYFDDEGIRSANSSATFPLSASFANDYENGGTAWSLYSQVTFLPSVDGPWAITGGIRYTEEEKDVTQLHRSNAFPGGFVGAFFAGVPFESLYTNNIDNPGTMPEVAGVYGRSYSNDFDNVSGKLTLAYDFSEAVNGYFTYSTGYRSGGFNGEAFDAENDRAVQFDEEHITNYEIGIKSDLLDGRMRANAALFSYTYEDQQVSTLSEENGVVTSRTTNGGETDRTGLELELTFLPTESVQLGLAYTYLDTDHKSFPAISAGGTVLETTDYVTRGLMPENQIAFNADWTIAETNSGVWLFNLNGTWQDESFPIGINAFLYNAIPDAASTPDTPVIHRQIPLDSRTIVNARLAFNEMPVGNGTLNFGLWGRNLLDEDYSAFAFNFGSGLGLNQQQFGVPLTYGIDVIYRY